MQSQDLPFTRDLVLIGGGHSHALILKRWVMSPLPGTRVTLINPGPTAPYSGMLPGHLAGHYPRDALDIDLVRLTRFAGARLIIDRAVALDPETRRVTLASGQQIAFDVASLDIGVTSDMPEIPGFAQHGIAAKPLDHLAQRWQSFLAEEGSTELAVIGGGVAGAEIALACAHALEKRNRFTEIALLDRSEILSTLPSRIRGRLLKRLKEAGIYLHPQTSVTAVTATHLETDKGPIAARCVIGAAGARPHPWLQHSGLDLTDGFITVDPHLETSVAGIFASGDCAHMQASHRPKAGVFAVRQAPYLFENLRARLAGKEPRHDYHPQSRYLKLISLGSKSALADRINLPVTGRLIWTWKDHIDRKFMRKFQDLPKMHPPKMPQHHAAGLDRLLQDKPLCGGCGAKVGQPALMTALSATGDDTCALPGDDAAVLSVNGAPAVLSTDHLRAMSLDPIAMTQIAAHHALGDIWAMAAIPHSATANLVIPQASGRIATRMLEEIMAAARAVFSQAGAQIAGGHSSQGAEMTIGFTVLGTCPRPPITLRGAGPGDRILLTKPLGSGLIMAAEMMGDAPGATVVSAMQHMLHSQRRSSEILNGAHAMTDVTGFGLLGHLHNICLNSGVGAAVNLGAVPLMDGALAIAETGLRASLHKDNRQILPELPETARHDLLFDPQTAGGLLAVVPETATHLLTELREAGYPAEEIGQITEERGQISVR